MNRQEIMAILPHRDDMLLLDEAFLEDEVARGIYRVRGDEWFLKGHFPGSPVVPGVILCEILAQSTCVLLSKELKDGNTPFFTSLEKVRFKTPVFPGDVIETRSRLVKKKPPFYFAQGEATVSGNICVKAEFSCALLKR